MADFDSFNYDIESRLPEWWKGFGALEPINKYTQELIAEILQGLLTTMGVVQPLNCWLSIPEEYNWYHHYQPLDDFLVDENGNKVITERPVTTLFRANQIHAIIPNTKRNCHARIQLKLLGTEIARNKEGEVDEESGSLISSKEIIDELKIINADQEIVLNNITTTSVIEISTENNEIIVDGVSSSDIIDGRFNKIKPVIKNADYQEVYIDETEYYPINIENISLPENFFEEENNNKIFYIEKNTFLDEKIYKIFTIDNTTKKEETYNVKISDIKIDQNNKLPIYTCIFCDETGEQELGTANLKAIDSPLTSLSRKRNIGLEDENKKTEIILDMDSEQLESVDFDLQVYLYKPTYTTEQNIRIASVSAFPIEWVRLYGYFCHPFNNHSGYKFLWEKKYKPDSRTVFDRITKQYDCERFYIQVKFQGIGVPLVKGFPQEIGETNAAFQPNPNLDKWGKIYGLPRRSYKQDITEDEEPFTFPKYYKYPIEQDYWYEERMTNEYKFEDDAVNSMFVRDDEFNNIGLLECIYPFMNDIWVYTETIDPTQDNTHKVQNDFRDDIPLSYATQKEDSLGLDWENPQTLKNKPILIKLNPQSDNVKKKNDYSYQTKKLNLTFNLNDFDDFTPKNITIKGIELKFQTEVNVQPNTIRLGEDSKIIIPYPNPNSETNYTLEKIDVIRDDTTWLKEKGYFTIGGENNLFFEKEISREQLFNGNDGKVEFELVFINENDFLEATLYLANPTLNIYYEIIPNEYSIDVEFERKEIDLSDEEKSSINMEINIQNTGKIEVHDKELFIIIPPELTISNGFNSYLFNLNVGEVCDPLNIEISPCEINGEIKTGWYDILVLCEDKIIQNEIIVRGEVEEP